MKQVNFRIQDELLSQLDDEADAMHITRTQFIITAVTQLIDAKRFMRSQPDINRKMIELQNMLGEVASSRDKDFAGLFGQNSIFDE